MSVIQMPVAAKSTDSDYDETFIRQTYYVTSELIFALDKIAEMEHTKKSAVLRDLLSSAIAEKYPSLFEEVEDEAEAFRKDYFGRLRKKLKLDEESKRPKKPHK